MPQVAVVLFQLGGPDSMDAVEPFLINLFSDPDIFDFPGAFFARKILARRIAARRSKIAGEHYGEIGGKSPINDLTALQASALEASLGRAGIRASVFAAMRYWKPLTEDAVAEIQKGAFDRIVLLPLYPQFSRATTFSSVNEWRRKCRHTKLRHTPTSLICCYPNHPLYIESLVDHINATLKRFGATPPESIDLLFSAHGVPEQFIEQGDPYKIHVEETVRKTMERGKWQCPHTICYQSRVGSSRWLEPSLSGTISSYAERGRKNLLVVPVSFVTDHIETLHEIDIEAREFAGQRGVEQFEMMPALNGNEKFIRCLTELVLERVLSDPGPSSTCQAIVSTHPTETGPTLCPWFEASGGDHEVIKGEHTRQIR